MKVVYFMPFRLYKSMAYEKSKMSIKSHPKIDKAVKDPIYVIIHPHRNFSSRVHSMIRHIAHLLKFPVFGQE